MSLNTAMGIGYDVTYELNEFGEPKLRSEIEVIKNTILIILFAKPGQYPSLPMIGLDIQNLLYTTYDELDCDDLRDRIITQCGALGVFFKKNIIAISKVRYKNQPSLMIHIEGQETYPEGYRRDSIGTIDRFKIGISFDTFKKMVVTVNGQGGS